MVWNVSRVKSKSRNTKNNKDKTNMKKKEKRRKILLHISL